MTFWADVPPRTWKLLDASFSAFTPGSICSERMTSPSPSSEGAAVSSFSCSCSAPTCRLCSRWRAELWVTTTSSSCCVRRVSPGVPVRAITAAVSMVV